MNPLRVVPLKDGKLIFNNYVATLLRYVTEVSLFFIFLNNYIPFKFAQFLENKFVHKNIFVQSTTRSPVIVNENEAIKSSVSFKDNYNDHIDNYIYNLDVNQYDKIFILYETDEKYNVDLRSNNTDKNCIFHINLE